MKPFKRDDFIRHAIDSNLTQFDELAAELYGYQKAHNLVFNQFIATTATASRQDFRFLPVEFFKKFEVKSGNFSPQKIFTSSTTSGSVPAKHFVANEMYYQKSYTKAFELFYGNPQQYVFLCLLPSYLERSGSSLIDMAEGLIKQSGDDLSGFYLYDFEKLSAAIKNVQQQGKRVFLLGVTFALIDFAEQFTGSLEHDIVMETGGMKGRRAEQTRQEIHAFLNEKFKTPTIHSEYGMTELLSQAYSKGNGVFVCPPWMKVVITDVQDPFCEMPIGKAGLINIIDLANVDSCAFIQTSDIGKLNADGSFEVLGRMDHSEVRGCNLMYQ
jgi:hypothetical protein